VALLIQSDDIGIGWKDVLDCIRIYGKIVCPRGRKTKEIQNLTLDIRWGLRNIIDCRERDLNYKFMVAEWLWILAGLNNLEILAKYNSQMRKFSDDGQILNGAYGSRLMPQIPYIVNNLSNKDTRQAVATIWTPNPMDSRDIPCTISLQWLIRDEELNCIVNMRSSDAWLGLPYDYFTFSQITNFIAYLIKVPVGTVTMNLASSHLYEENWSIADSILKRHVFNAVESPDFSEYEDVKLEGLEFLLTYPVNYDNYTGMLKQYGKILANPREKALEVLRELSPL